jgi:anti-sigma-K factor RskA
MRSMEAPDPRAPGDRGAAVAAMAAAVIALAVVQAGTQHRLERAQSANRAVAAVLTVPGGRIVTSRTAVGGVVTAGMPAPRASRVYQLWLIGVSGARSAGLLPGTSAGGTPPVLATDVQPGDRLAITIEPAGGSARPTTAPAVVLAATA